MRLAVAAVGRLKSGPEAELVADYAARVRAIGRAIGVPEFKIIEVEAPKGLDGHARKKRESALLLAAAPASAKHAILDERGSQLSSEAFAKLIGDWRDRGAPEAVFMIGGADGLDESARESAEAIIAFGKATWPHMLVRAMLCEQIYRAMTILSRHPYHRA
jgi:23S rRNA (pseudouridine1915-N3)-methyltransferase